MKLTLGQTLREVTSDLENSLQSHGRPGIPVNSLLWLLNAACHYLALTDARPYEMHQ